MPSDTQQHRGQVEPAVTTDIPVEALRPWFIVGCMECDYSGHTPSPPERCPNDGTILLRMDGLIVGHKVVEVARYMVRAAQLRARADLDAASAKCNYANAANIIDRLAKRG